MFLNIHKYEAFTFAQLIFLIPYVWDTLEDHLLGYIEHAMGTYQEL